MRTAGLNEIRELLRSELFRRWYTRYSEQQQILADTRDAMAELEAREYQFIGGARPFRDCEFAFMHPRKMNGVLLELIDYKWEELGDK